MLLRACLSGRMGLEPSMADGNITVEVSTQAAQAELERLRAENAALKRDLQYARDGLTKGRTRMREDNERLRAALVKIEAGCCIDPRTVAREALGPNDGSNSTRAAERNDPERAGDASRLGSS